MSKAGQSEKAEVSLPVVNPVVNYEKIKRIGEGTYGVVCEDLLSLFPKVRNTIISVPSSS